MVICSLPDCTYEDRKTNFFKYPHKNRERWEEWKKILSQYYENLNFEKLSTGKICFQHFEDDYLLKCRRTNRIYVTENAVPTIFGQKKLKSARKTRFQTNPKMTLNSEISEKFEKKCRLCLETAYSSNALDQPKLEKIELLINRSLQLSIELPSLLCTICSENIDKFVEFRTKILKNQDLLSDELMVLEIKKEELDHDEMVVAEDIDYFYSSSTTGKFTEISLRRNLQIISYVLEEKPLNLMSEIKCEEESDNNFHSDIDNGTMDYSHGKEAAENAETPKKPVRKKAGKYGEFV